MKFHMSARSYCHTELWHIYIHLLPMSAWLVYVHIPCTSVYGIPCIPFHQAGKSWNKVTFAWPLFVETVIKFSIVWPSFTYETHQIHQTRPEGPTVQSQWSTSQSPSDESVASNLRFSQNFFKSLLVLLLSSLSCGAVCLGQFDRILGSAKEAATSYRCCWWRPWTLTFQSQRPEGTTRFIRKPVRWLSTCHFDFQAHGQSVGAPTNVRGVLLPVGFSTGPKSRSTCAWPKPQSRHCLAKFGKAGLQLLGHVSSAILEALWCPKTYQINRIQCPFSSGVQVPSVCQHLSAVGRSPGTGPCMCRPVCARDILGMPETLMGPSCHSPNMTPLHQSRDGFPQEMKSGAHSKYRAWPTTQNLRWEWCSLQSIAEGAPSGWRLLAQLSKNKQLFLCSLPLLYWLRQIVAWIRIRGPESRLVKSMTHSIPETQPGWPIGNRKEVHDVNQLVVHLHLNKSYETLWAKWRLQDFQLLCVVFRITVYRQDQVFFSKGIFWEYSPNWRSTSEENFETYDVVPFGWCRKEQWLVANKAVQAKIFGSIKSAKLNWNEEPFSL